MFEPGDVAGERRPGVGQQAAEVTGEVVDVDQRVADRLPVLCQPAEQALQLDDQLIQLAVARVHRREHGVEVGDDVADDGVAVGDRVGQRGGADQQLVERAALALQGLR